MAVGISLCAKLWCIEMGKALQISRCVLALQMQYDVLSKGKFRETTSYIKDSKSIVAKEQLDLIWYRL